MDEIPIFPLPNAVFFPRTMLPLRIFEPRYRKMVEDVLEGDGRIGIVLSRSETGEGMISPIGVVGTIAEIKEREDGDYDILLNGVSRFRILRMVAEEPYRRAVVEPLREVYEERDEDAESAAELIDRFRRLIGEERITRQEYAALAEAGFPTLVNSLCAAIQIDLEDKQTLLEIDNVSERAEAILAVVRQLSAQKEFVDSFAHLRPKDPTDN